MLPNSFCSDDVVTLHLYNIREAGVVLHILKDYWAAFCYNVLFVIVSSENKPGLWNCVQDLDEHEKQGSLRTRCRVANVSITGHQF